ncbi:helix-turn-helix transcriptional regulator [Streptantibioticus rubrisoli]|uniref:Helix-turn-helix domain-containing protein n=1 Tax=Streptantibioticus rubrisoli TaxID=1387313 RepID=A0ABT1PEP1_9ACTN|nr:helix-turn-helix domain-containing protein [Streptantibioticus rubrisoli]MCQ4043842.1 helix-turn-helix domain-containing protein [Streptantibioticus rubrisoli]
MDAPTLDEIRNWPATVPVPDAAKAIRCSKSHLYELIKRGEAPVKVLPLGRRYVVVTASLVRLLEAA